METMDRIIGIWMIIAGGAMFAFSLTLEQYLGTLSGVTLYVVAIPTAILLSVPAGTLIVFGMAQAAGVITIQVERRKLI